MILLILKHFEIMRKNLFCGDVLDCLAGILIGVGISIFSFAGVSSVLEPEGYLGFYLD